MVGFQVGNFSGSDIVCFIFFGFVVPQKKSRGKLSEGSSRSVAVATGLKLKANPTKFFQQIDRQPRKHRLILHSHSATQHSPVALLFTHAEPVQVKPIGSSTSAHRYPAASVPFDAMVRSISCSAML